MGKTTTNIQNVLRGQALFAGLSEGDIADIAKTCKELELEVGETIFSQGEESKEFYLLLEGDVEVRKTSPAGVERLLTRVSAESVLGEMSIILNEKRSATLICKTPVRAIQVDAKGLSELMSSGSISAFRLGINTLRLVAARLNAMNQAILQLQDQEEKEGGNGHLSELAKLRHQLLKEWSF